VEVIVDKIDAILNGCVRMLFKCLGGLRFGWFRKFR